MADLQYTTQETEYNKKIIELCRCGICYDIVNPQCQACNKGHVFCKECCIKLKPISAYEKWNKSCPICKELIHYNSELKFIKSLYDSLNIILPCQYSSHGCKEILKINVYHEHSEKCIYSPIKCIKCENEYDLQDIQKNIEHMVQLHNYVVLPFIDDKYITDVDISIRFTLNLHVSLEAKTNYFIVKYSKYDLLEISVTIDRLYVSISFDIIKTAKFIKSEVRTYQIVFNKIGEYTNLKKIIIGDDTKKNKNLILIGWDDINKIIPPRTDNTHITIPVKFIPYSIYINDSYFDVNPICTIPSTQEIYSENINVDILN